MCLFPVFLTHYYREFPFRTLTDSPQSEVDHILAKMAELRELPHRLRSTFYFEQRREFELRMHRQFVAKGGHPCRNNPHYMVLGESEIWADIEPRAIRIPLSHFPSTLISFTYSDSWTTYVDRDLRGNPIPRKSQYHTVYRLEELDSLFKTYGWPGDRWKTDPDWEHDIYVEAQIWSDEPLRAYLDGQMPQDDIQRA